MDIGSSLFNSVAQLSMLGRTTHGRRCGRIATLVSNKAHLGELKGGATMSGMMSVNNGLLLHHSKDSRHLALVHRLRSQRPIMNIYQFNMGSSCPGASWLGRAIITQPNSKA
eukprot:scaffold266910_cov16-Prasinocladus_malaysianus.AAC.1